VSYGQSKVERINPNLACILTKGLSVDPAVFLFGLIQAGQRLLDQTLPIAQAGMRKTDAAEVFRGLAVGLRLPELRSLNEDYLSLSETQSCWQLISNRAMLLPYARGL
jgi:hypothetical protein